MRTSFMAVAVLVGATHHAFAQIAPAAMDGWKVHEDKLLHYSIATPPSWTVMLPKSSKDAAFTIDDVIADDVLVSCTVRTGALPQIAELDQNSLNRLTLANGPVKADAVAATFPGAAVDVYSSTLDEIQGHIADVVVAAMANANGDLRYQRVMQMSFMAPGHYYGFGCTVAAASSDKAEAEFNKALPSMLAIMRSLSIK